MVKRLLQASRPPEPRRGRRARLRHLPRARRAWAWARFATRGRRVRAGASREAGRAMIGRIQGMLAEKNPPQVVVVRHGVGYEIDVPMSTFYHLPRTGEEVRAAHAPRRARGRAPALRLPHRGRARGVPPAAARSAASGPKVALSVLSGLSVEDLSAAVAAQDAGAAHQDSRHRQEDRRAPACSSCATSCRRPSAPRAAARSRAPRRRPQCAARPWLQ